MRVLRSGRRLPGSIALDDDLVIEADNADVLPRLPDGAFDLVYIDPPFNTGRRRERRTLRAVLAYEDAYDDYLGFLVPRLEHARRLLAPQGTLYVHLDQREAHAVKLALDDLFGADAFLNELIWAYDYGGKPRSRWPAKHDTILVYVRTPGGHHFDADAVEREPYMAPGLVGPEKAARGKMPTDVWFHTIVPTNSFEKTGYPTQKPEGVVRRIVSASSREGGWCLDFFAGSGTLGAVCAKLDRRFVLVDSNPEAVDVMLARLNGENAPAAPTEIEEATG